ncbi:uncharacterized protein LOC122250366 [Penaeus japonicus]|uniref:uncharacterized protein LOC122250366 n=1 Tax=Penaeus japonicus TaxID=27405 RepID=UPI001C7161AC|nr:uncharacterized protein LOC122250366 [Penaeus japonicus]
MRMNGTKRGGRRVSAPPITQEAGECPHGEANGEVKTKHGRDTSSSSSSFSSSSFSSSSISSSSSSSSLVPRNEARALLLPPPPPPRVVYSKDSRLEEVLEEPWVVEGEGGEEEEEEEVEEEDEIGEGEGGGGGEEVVVETETPSAEEGLESCVVDLAEDFNRIFNVNSFGSFQEFEKLFNKFKEETGSVFRVKSSCSVAYENSRRKKHFIPTRFKFVSIKYCCVHYGQPKVTGQGIRTKQRYLPCGCGCVLSLAYNRGALFISQVIMQHNHEVSNEMAPYYAINRRISNSELRQVAHVIDLMPSSRSLQQFLQEHFHRPITLQDAKNIRARLKMLQMQPHCVIKHNVKAISQSKEEKHVEEEERHVIEHEIGEEATVEREGEFTELEVVACDHDLQDYKQCQQQHFVQNFEDEQFSQPKWKTKVINEVKTKIVTLMNSWETNVFWERVSVINKLIECWENGDNFDLNHNPETVYSQGQGLLIKQEPESTLSSGKMGPQARRVQLGKHRKTLIDRKVPPSKNEPESQINLMLPLLSGANVQLLPTSFKGSSPKLMLPQTEKSAEVIQKRRPGRPRKYPIKQKEGETPVLSKSFSGGTVPNLEMGSKGQLIKSNQELQPIVLSVTRDSAVDASDQAIEVEIEVNGDEINVKRIKQEPLEYCEVDAADLSQYQYGEHSYV